MTASQSIKVSSPARLSIQVSGVVQGVGFRPFVHNLAVKHALTGYVLNAGGQVEIEVQGTPADLTRFLQALKKEAPPLSAVDHVLTTEIPQISAEECFSIKTSTGTGNWPKMLPPDAATCADCLKELFDPDDRRFCYPFINCTNCGPRFTIIKSLPYDRPATTMSQFSMCRQCQSEYDDPGNRRFHAQPNACPACGPSLSFLPAGILAAGRKAIYQQITPGCQDISPVRIMDESRSALSRAIEQLKAGEIIAAKGLGGFHLLCDASNDKAVLQLRERKGRYGKPLAVMMRNLEMARKYCRMTSDEEALLTGSARPIVLLEKNMDAQLAESIAPGLNHMGVMLPYTPLHHLLAAGFAAPLVATSGNKNNEPIAIDNDQAVERLSGVACGFLLHNRAIACRYDDSVSRVFDGVEILIRRSRGYAPVPLALPFSASAPVLACGAHLKNTFCLIDGSKAYVSQHIGDLDTADTYDYFHDLLEKFLNLFSIKPQMVAHDLHPDYISSKIAGEIARGAGLPVMAVQHHHAHIVSCMTEHKICRPVIGVAFDGLGYGSDGTLWGGEFLICSQGNFQRRAHFTPVALPGGDIVVKQPWRMTLSYLMSGSRQNRHSLDAFIERLSQTVDRKTIALLEQQIDKRLNCPSSSSCGRLFDAISAALGICLQANYEGQAAMQLEALATDAGACLPYDFSLLEEKNMLEIDPAGIVEQALSDLNCGIPEASIARRFHHTVASIILQVCRRLRQQTGLTDVCLSGGVFQNVLLLRDAVDLLRSAGFKVFFPQRLPAGDGGVSLGQAVACLSAMNMIQS